MTEQSQQKEKKRPGIVKQLIVILFSIAILYLAIVWLVMPVYTRQWQAVRVPNVTHVSMRAAEKVLEDKHLRVVKAEEVFDDSSPAGFVIFQSPLPNATVKKGRNIYLTISKGSRIVKVPDFVGSNIRDVRFTLSQFLLEIGAVEYVHDQFYPEGVIVEQAIDPDQEVHANTPIDLTVSLGQEPTVFEIPDLIGKTKNTAEFTIMKNNFFLDRVSYYETDRFPAGIVINQEPEPGTKAVEGDTLNIVISESKTGAAEAKRW